MDLKSVIDALLNAARRDSDQWLVRSDNVPCDVIVVRTALFDLAMLAKIRPLRAADPPIM
jgi:hypothetical protein